MNFADGVRLISHPAIIHAAPAHWADLGCGTGFFTGVLSSLLARGSTVYAIDADAGAVKKVKVNEGIHLQTFSLDFVQQPLPFNKVDGILLANALHYVKDKNSFIEKLRQHLAVSGVLLFVEYDTSAANPWVPYPIMFTALQQLCQQHGFTTVEKINSMPSAFGRSNLYGAVAVM